jgi:hypothetical protein
MYRFLLITEGRFIYNQKPRYLEATTEELLWNLLFSFETYTINLRDSEGNNIDILQNLELIEAVEVTDNV